MFYLTTSRPYTNSTPHLGTAIDAIYADAISRFCREEFHRKNSQEKVFFSMGTDEHSFKIADKALELGISPKEFVDQKYLEFKELYDTLEISYDGFDQNSTQKHSKISNLVWNKLQDKGYIYSKMYVGLYCKGCEDFKSESQLDHGKCPIHPNLDIQHVEEQNYFFKLSSFKTKLEQYLNTVFVPDTSVLVEMRNFIEKLEDISISRDRSRLSLDWGVVIESDPKHVMYVWFEALITYLSALVSQDYSDTSWLEIEQKLPQDLIVIGRDNSKFHLVILPALLLALDLPVPKSALIHGMINDSQGRKFAKSLGNGVELKDFIEKMGVEGVRFFVLHDCNPIGDTNFDWERVIESHNSNLANNLGNLVSRVSNLVEKYYPSLKIENSSYDGVIVDTDLESHIKEYISNLDTRSSLKLILAELTKINQHLEQTKPWSLAKNLEENQLQIHSILKECVESILYVNRSLKYFLPETSDKIESIFIQAKITKAEPLFIRLSI